MFRQNEERQLLFNTRTRNEKWYKKIPSWFYKASFICILLVVVLYYAYDYLFGNNDLTNSYEATKLSQSINPLHISSIATTNGDYLTKCAPQVKCDPNTKYRSINGSCNNFVTPTWGASETPFIRMFNANYDDGFYKIRLQSNGDKLPSPRLLDNDIFLARQTYRVDENNVLLVPFGQLMAHDVSGLYPDLPRDAQDNVIDCCTDANARETFAQCQVILHNSPDDPVYAKYNVSCMGILRAKTSRNYSCPLVPTTYINANTHFLDASEVYGSTDDIAHRIRAMVGGLLKTSTGDGGQTFCPYLANQYRKPEFLNYKVQYDTGNVENGNQNLGITSMQTLFVRFHNYLASNLSSLNPSWSDEILYQESRRIVIGAIQHIVYEDFLPIIIGEDFQESYGFNVEDIYDPTINPSTSIEFTTAAYRTLHNIIPVQFNFMDNDYKTEFSVNITDWLNKPDLLPIRNYFDSLLKGFLETPGRVPQPSYNFQASNYMFNTNNSAPYTGIDLMALDFTRGRDVGLQPYNQFRQLCGLPLAKNFDDLTDLLHIKDVNKLKEHYHSVDDIDLMVGLLLEKRSDDALVGPTARCLIADCFYRYKAGDRFFYDVRGQPGSFTPSQLKVIKKITLGHVLCASSNVDRVQKDIFKLVDHNLFPTEKLTCDDEFSIDLNAWKESNDR